MEKQKIKQSYRKGLGFGITSGVITTLGLIIGLESGTHSFSAVLSGIITIAIADALSDALGIHISEESSKTTTQKNVWESTIATFFTKFIIALSFAVPILLLPLETAVLICIVWGMALLALFSIYVADVKGEKIANVVLEHWTIAIAVIITTFLVGTYVVSALFSA